MILEAHKKGSLGICSQQHHFAYIKKQHSCLPSTLTLVPQLSSWPPLGSSWHRSLTPSGKDHELVSETKHHPFLAHNLLYQVCGLRKKNIRVPLLPSIKRSLQVIRFSHPLSENRIAFGSHPHADICAHFLALPCLTQKAPHTPPPPPPPPHNPFSNCLNILNSFF